MSTMDTRARALFSDESGQDLIEYALIASLVGLGAIASVNTFATALQGVLSSIASSFQNAT